ncbi:mini-chromosome maintenance complex-binding protein [Kipferlia bialata]|uniref:Mini-chromosome maintenance complex-binding protein n=1 Tax=Kipferlia bialata TaxID=797122 RepID=A0A9K3CTW0_9EUKA|nr:mini-chromosome maintenance complex-binding protein [Kipferlia bialata]|eukprot:g3441.t1
MMLSIGQSEGNPVPIRYTTDKALNGDQFEGVTPIERYYTLSRAVIAPPQNLSPGFEHVSALAPPSDSLTLLFPGKLSLPLCQVVTAVGLIDSVVQESDPFADVEMVDGAQEEVLLPALRVLSYETSDYYPHTPSEGAPAKAPIETLSSLFLGAVDGDALVARALALWTVMGVVSRVGITPVGQVPVNLIPDTEVADESQSVYHRVSSVLSSLLPRVTGLALASPEFGSSPLYPEQDPSTARLSPSPLLAPSGTCVIVSESGLEEGARLTPVAQDNVRCLSILANQQQLHVRSGGASYPVPVDISTMFVSAAGSRTVFRGMAEVDALPLYVSPSTSETLADRDQGAVPMCRAAVGDAKVRYRQGVEVSEDALKIAGVDVTATLDRVRGLLTKHAMEGVQQQYTLFGHIMSFARATAALAGEDALTTEAWTQSESLVLSLFSRAWDRRDQLQREREEMEGQD